MMTANAVYVIWWIITISIVILFAAVALRHVFVDDEVDTAESRGRHL